MIILPLEVYYRNGKTKRSKLKKFILNLNNYRNTNGHELGYIKTAYKELIWHSIPNIKHTDSVELVYTYYRKDKVKIDVANPCSIIDKFACDVLVDKGVIADDNWEYVKRSVYQWGGVDKENPRCELSINKL